MNEYIFTVAVQKELYGQEILVPKEIQGSVVRCKDCMYSNFESYYSHCTKLYDKYNEHMDITTDTFCYWGRKATVYG